MITLDNILTLEDRTSLKHIIDEEIKNNLCYEVPLYQSWSNMHERYIDNRIIQELNNRALKEAEIISNQKLKVLSLWFNISRKDSNYEFHTHDTAYITCVYFLKNCENNGPIFQLWNSNLQLLCKDDTLIIFDPKTTHRIPEWNGKDRYSVAIDYIIQD